MSISNSLKLMRAESGLTQEEAAAAIGVTRQCLSSYETGRTCPDIDTLNALAKVYNVDVIDIIYGTSRKLKPYTTIKYLEMILFIFQVITTAIYSFADRMLRSILVYLSGEISKEYIDLLEKSKKLSNIRNCLSYLCLIITFAAVFFLIVYCSINNKRSKLKQRILWVLVSCGSMIAVAFLIGIGDTAFYIGSYLEIPMLTSALLLLYLMIDLVNEIIQNRRSLKHVS